MTRRHSSSSPRPRSPHSPPSPFTGTMVPQSPDSPQRTLELIEEYIDSVQRNVIALAPLVSTPTDIRIYNVMGETIQRMQRDLPIFASIMYRDREPLDASLQILEELWETGIHMYGRLRPENRRRGSRGGGGSRRGSSRSPPISPNGTSHSFQSSSRTLPSSSPRGASSPKQQQQEDRPRRLSR